MYLLLAVDLDFAATLGASVLIFQHGMQHNGVIFTLPLTLFLFVVAIGTDYKILICSRLREELEHVKILGALGSQDELLDDTTRLVDLALKRVL